MWDPNRVSVNTRLVPWSERERSQQEIAAELRGPLKDIPGAIVHIRSPNSLSLWRAGGSIQFALTGTSYADLAIAADGFVADMRDRLPQYENPQIEYQQTQPQLSVEVDRRRAEDLGVPVDNITDLLRAMAMP